MKPTVFYSWQSDAALDDCKHFIRDALKDALKALKRDDEIVDALRLDQDTKGVAGTPDVAATIYSKISTCAVFVSDLTLVGNANSKKMPNANVALETGYAAAEVGWPRIIGVMNTSKSFGTSKELIFDLIHKRHPIEYSFDDEKPDRCRIRQGLAGELAIRIKASLSESHTQAERMLARLDFQTYTFMSRLGKSRFFNLGPNEGVLQGQLVRLLDLGLLRFEHSLEAGLYAYHWTYLGHLVLGRLGIMAA